MTREQTTPRRLQRLPQLGKTLPNAYLDIKTMIDFFKNTNKAAVMPQDSTSNLFLSLPGYSGNIIQSLIPPTNRPPKQIFNKITQKMFLDAVMADNYYFSQHNCAVLHHTTSISYVLLQCTTQNTDIVYEQCMYVAN